jgi:hypothetical protein
VRPEIRFPIRKLALVIAAVALVCVDAPAHAGPQLMPNPGFELSQAEGSVAVGGGVIADQPSPANGVLIQPLLPSGWAFEGSAGLFDHTDNGSDVLGARRNARSGKRYAAISLPASGKKEQCVDQVSRCVENPATGPKENTVAAVYSVNPVWRNAVPVRVNPGQAYVLSVWTSGELMTAGTRAFARVRWLSAGGTVLSLSPEASYTVRDTDFCNAENQPGGGTPGYCWRQISVTATAPAGAATAVVLLGHSEDTWIGQVMFDDVFFG